MKFYSKDPIFFVDVSNELSEKNPSVSVGHLNCLGELHIDEKKKLIVAEETLDSKQLVSEIFNKEIFHFVQKNKDSFVDDLSRTGNLIENPDQYFEFNYAFVDSEKPLPDGVNSIELSFSSDENKSEVFHRIAKFLEPIASTAAKEAAMAAIEELYMNATIDALKEAHRQGLQVAASHCRMFLFYNQDTLQISCSDSFGSLDLKKLFTRLYEVYQKGPGAAINLQAKEGGAGIGCFLMLEQCRDLIFGVRRGVETKVTCLIPLAISNRERAKIKKSLHGFEVK